MHQLTLVDAPVLGSVYYATDGCNIKIGHTERQPKRRGGEIEDGDASTRARVACLTSGVITGCGRSTGSAAPSGSDHLAN